MPPELELDVEFDAVICPVLLDVLLIALLDVSMFAQLVIEPMAKDTAMIVLKLLILIKLPDIDYSAHKYAGCANDFSRSCDVFQKVVIKG